MATRKDTAHRPVLDQRALNRALLDRQMLLARSDRTVPEAVAFLYGLQAQAPWSPYQALWTRLVGFDPHELGAMLTDRRAVRVVLMRATVHLVTADDALALRHLHAAYLERGLRRSNWARGLPDGDLDEVAAHGRALVEQQPLPFRALGTALAERWPDRDPAALAQVVRGLVPLVQVPPRAVWGKAGQVTVTTAEHWLDRPVDTGATLDETSVFGFKNGQGGVEQVAVGDDDDVEPRGDLVATENLSYQSFGAVSPNGAT